MLFPNKKIDTSDPDRIFYSDGSCSWSRDAYFCNKTETERLESELEKFPDLPSWKNYELPSGYIAAKSVIDSLLDAYYKREDILAFESSPGSDDHPSNKDIPRKLPSQSDQEKSIEIADHYIEACKKDNKIPIIADCVLMVKKQYTKSLYVDGTIHDWIKCRFPKESRLPGRKPGWKERQIKSK